MVEERPKEKISQWKQGKIPRRYPSSPKLLSNLETLSKYILHHPKQFEMGTKKWKTDLDLGGQLWAIYSG